MPEIVQSIQGRPVAVVTRRRGKGGGQPGSLLSTPWPLVLLVGVGKYGAAVGGPVLAAARRQPIGIE
jgi:hypothetical protein